MLDTTTEKVATGLIFMPARNCEMYAAEALRSLSRQTMDDIFVLYVDDASEDQTGDIARHYLQELFPGRHDYIRNPSHFGKSRNVWEHLRPRAHLAEFIAVLDADDQLFDLSVLQAMANNYAAGKDVVWTNYFTDSGLKGANTTLDETRSPREQRWVTSHFFSFRASLLPNVPESYFKDSAGDWYLGACDVSLAMPILDQTRAYKFIPVPAYRYTTANPFSLHNSMPKVNAITSQLQLKNSQEIRAKPPLPLASEIQKQRDTMTKPAAAPAQPSQKPRTTSASTWDGKAADLLISRCPALLTAQSMAANATLSPLQAWSLATLAEQQEGDILYLGDPNTALPLAAIVAALPNRNLTCLVNSAQDAGDLRARLALAGVSQQVEIVEGPLSNVTMDGKSCNFPSVAGLKDKAPFSLVIIDPRAEADEETFSVIALPAVSEKLAPAGFRFCSLSTDIASAQAMVQKLSKLTVGVDYCPGAVGGTGFVAAPEHKE